MLLEKLMPGPIETRMSNILDIFSKMAKKVGKVAIYFLKVATRKRVNHAGLRVLWPFAHLFLYFRVRKNI